MTQQQKQFEIQRIYLKDFSFEAPNTPFTFLEEWKPEVTLNLETKSTPVQDHLHEVVLMITAQVATEKKPAFVVEIQQAGLFALQGFTREEVQQILGCDCPTILFPYAREAVASAVMRGGFPQLTLAPVNFMALYQEHLSKENGASTIN